MKRRRRYRNNGTWTHTTAPIEERRLRDLGLVPVQPLAKRVSLLYLANIEPVWGPRIDKSDTVNIQIHAWLPPHVAQMLRSNLTESARVYLFTQCGRMTPGERDTVLKALGSIMALEGPGQVPATSGMLRETINGATA